ncbi:MAG: cytochrome oxidase small assembly protein [Ideonella sp.]|nr:cytochrome oxidase small assembly protein [Ideonella sp.]
MRPTPAQRRANVRLALILATVALVLGLGFVAKIGLTGSH